MFDGVFPQGDLPQRPDAVSRIDKAMALLKENGWAKHWMWESGEICGGQALLEAYGLGKIDFSEKDKAVAGLPVTPVLLAAINATYPGDHKFFPIWNDTRDNVEDVLAILAKARRWILAGKCLDYTFTASDTFIASLNGRLAALRDNREVCAMTA
jgi:hypothetical protein